MTITASATRGSLSCSSAGVSDVCLPPNHDARSSTVILVLRIATSCSKFFCFVLSHSSFWTSCGLRCPPLSPPVRAFSFFIVHRVQHSHCSSILIECCYLTLSRFPRVNLYTRKSPYEFIRVCTRGDSNSRN